LVDDLHMDALHWKERVIELPCYAWGPDAEGLHGLMAGYLQAVIDQITAADFRVSAVV
jgi:hypothetical protein